MHKKVERAVSLRTQPSIASHNQAINIIAPSFSIGYFALVRRVNDRGHKLRFRWYGPCRITTINSPLVYSVASLHDIRVENVHCARLKQYHNSLLRHKVPKELLDLADRTQSRYKVVEKIIDVGEAHWASPWHDGLFCQVHWEGLPNKRDWTWQPVSELYYDIPEVFIRFLDSTKAKKTTVSKVKRQLNCSTRPQKWNKYTGETV